MRITFYTQKIKSFEPHLIIGIGILVCIGLTALYSAAGGGFSPWANKQLMRFIMGLILMGTIACIDIRFWRSSSYLLYIFSFVLLIFVELKGHIGMGAQRWIDLGFLQLQPSEIMKITLIMALAHYFHDKNDTQIGQLRTYIIPMILIALPCALVMRQPDLGTMLILAATGAFVIFMAGIRLWKVLTALGLSAASLPLLWMNMHTYQKKRILTFLDPESDPLGSGYHIMQSKISIGSGGFWGKGFLKGTQSQLQFLPEKQTDFIFAHFTEEFGVFGGTLLIILYGYIVVTALKMSYECKSYYPRLFGVGFTALFFLYVFINIGMVMGMLPVVGVPLPFMSYGGTSMMSLLIGFGILMSAYVHRQLRFGRSYS